MNNIFFLLFAITSFVCNKNHDTTLTGKWRLIKYHNLTKGTSESEPANIPRSVIIEFSDNGQNGKMNGHTVTNTVYKQFILSSDNSPPSNVFTTFIVSYN
jgi:hypothetical protein